MSSKQAIVREVNDRIRELHAGFHIRSGEYVVVCECRDPGCFERVAIPIDVYEDVRARDDGTVFTAPGHAPPEPIPA
jgi:hypothetical protein